jgi:hypothetical protein
MGKKQDPNKEDGDGHVSRPLSTLKDPALFGPPPKHVNYHGGAALPNEITPQRSGWGAPLTPEEIEHAASATSGQPLSRQQQQQLEEEEEEQRRAAGPPLPYRADRTGLKTDHLPPPPVHRDVNRNPDAAEASVRPKQPGLPPRLPSRQGTVASITPPPAVTASPPPQAPPPSYESVRPQPTATPPTSTNYGMNMAAVDRLGNAGVSVPGLGIGSKSPPPPVAASNNPWQNEPSSSGQAQPSTATGQLSELQSRFARIKMVDNSQTNNSSTGSLPYVTPAQSPPPAAQAGAQSTTWAEKQAALRTARDAHQDPSSVTVADAQSAARTANSFRDRHQESISAAGQRANEWNKKYNVTGRLNSFLEKHSSPTSENPPALNSPNGGGGVGGGSPSVAAPPSSTQPQSPGVTASISRKPPPPPPPKKPANMHGGVAPPPVPLGTKPNNNYA